MKVPTISDSNIPFVTVDQMREVDRLQVEEMGISITVMMENAARNTGVVVRDMLGGDIIDKHITILCGKGNNGGDGIAAARYITNWGASTQVILAEPIESLREIPKAQLSILEKMSVPISLFSEQDYSSSDSDPTSEESRSSRQARTVDFESLLSETDLIIDALVGYDLTGNLRKPIATLVNLANNSGKPILAMDIPSGLQGDSGMPTGSTIVASATLTLALPKKGLLKNVAKKYVGDVYVGDLSVSKEVYKRIGISVPKIFNTSEVIGLKNNG